MRITNGLSEDGQKRVLTKFTGKLPVPLIEGFDSPETSRLGMYIDCEATGLDIDGSDEITDLGYVIFESDRETGKILSVRKFFESLNEPTKQIPEVVSRITGLTMDMVKGHKIDWEKVKEDIGRVDFIIAHNARYDRKMLVKYLDIFAEKYWLCTANLIPWQEWGHPGAKLEYLAQDHGIFYDGHRALIDAKVGVYLLCEEGFEGKSYLYHALMNFVKPLIRIFAVDSNYDFKDFLKANGARWFPQKKLWYFEVIKGSEDHRRVIQLFEENPEMAGSPLVSEVSQLERYAESKD